MNIFSKISLDIIPGSLFDIPITQTGLDPVTQTFVSGYESVYLSYKPIWDK